MNHEEASLGNTNIDKSNSSSPPSSIPHENINKRLLQGLSSWKTERIRLKDLIKSLKSRLNEKSLAFAAVQASLAEILVAKTGEETTAEAKQIHKLAIELKERLILCEIELQDLREERDNSVLDITVLQCTIDNTRFWNYQKKKLLESEKSNNILKVLEEKVATCTLLAEEQDDFIQNQLETIQKLKSKIGDLQNNLHNVENSSKEEKTRLEEQIQLHQQRATIQDKKIKKLQHEYEVLKVKNYKFESKEFVLEEQLETQIKICQETTKELHTSTKEIEKISNICANLQEQQEKMEQTWCDNARLTQILASLRQYKDLVNEMHDGKGLVYLPPTSRGAKILGLSHRYECCKLQNENVDPKVELDQWIPAEAYDMLLAFRKKCCPNTSIFIFQELMADLSLFWKNRVKKQMASLKKVNEKRVMDLKRQLLQRIPYRQVVPTIPSKSIPKKIKKYELDVVTDQIASDDSSNNYEFQPLQVFYNLVPRRPKTAPICNTFAFEIPTPLHPHIIKERPLPWSFDS